MSWGWSLTPKKKIRDKFLTAIGPAQPNAQWIASRDSRSRTMLHHGMATLVDELRFLTTILKMGELSPLCPQ